MYVVYHAYQTIGIPVNCQLPVCARALLKYPGYITDNMPAT